MLPWVMAGALAIGLLVAGILLWKITRPVDRPLTRLNVDLGPEVVSGRQHYRDTLARWPPHRVPHANAWLTIDDYDPASRRVVDPDARRHRERGRRLLFAG